MSFNRRTTAAINPNVMEIKTAEFLVSNTDVKKCPGLPRPEYAFIGRSNVGKSSLINMLTGQKALAKVSSRPGKTQLINHFLIDGRWYLVDLPGYGYAKTSKAARGEFSRVITSYITGREMLTCLFVLVDMRLEPQAIDLRFMEWLGENGVPFAIVFTKRDKLSGNEARKNLDVYKNTLLKTWEELPPVFITSSESGAGRDELLGFIDEVNISIAGQL